MESPGRDQRRAEWRRNAYTLSREAKRSLATNTGRNLVLLFDGTGNILGNNQDTNVVKLLRRLAKDPSRQVAYYDPGVGTFNEFPEQDWGGKIRSHLRQLKGLALGAGAFDNIAEAYQFLCTEYREGDRIFLFGFSRGAFTARAVGGMVNMYGLVHAPGFPLIRSLVRTYFMHDSGKRDEFAADILANFSLGRAPLVYFTGVWDTVETIGLGGVAITNGKAIEHKRFAHVRHALSIHETRNKYKPRDYQPPKYDEAEQQVRTFRQAWFRGVHSDIGGSYLEAGLSNIALNWMMKEAAELGLLLDDATPFAVDPQQAMHDQVLESPLWVLVGLNARNRAEIPADYDPSSMPIADATPAKRRGGWLTLALGIVLTLAFLYVGWRTAQWGLLACDVSKSPAWVAHVPSAMQLLAPWHDALDMRCDPAIIERAIAWDWWFIPVYFFWFTYPLAWALRRLCAAAIATGASLRPLFANAHMALWLLVAFDIAENVFTAVQPQPWLAFAMCSVKLLLIAWLFVVVAAGALRTSPGSAAPRVAPATPATPANPGSTSRPG